METYEAHAITADWLNAWLAAIGITFLVPGCRLMWSDDPKPHAVFHSDDSLPASLARHLPDSSDLRALAIALTHDECSDKFPRKVSSETYRKRARVARQMGDFSLTSTVTDLALLDDVGNLRHSSFDPPVPKGITIWERVNACHAALPKPEELPALETELVASLTRGGTRVKTNGLAFDYRRLTPPTDPIGESWVDPAIELLAFCGLALFPVRGDGRRERTRGWQRAATRRGAFTWPAWKPSLDLAGIDAFLDRFWTRANRDPQVQASYASVAYQPLSSSDPTRGYASERLST